MAAGLVGLRGSSLGAGGGSAPVNGPSGLGVSPGSLTTVKYATAAPAASSARITPATIATLREDTAPAYEPPQTATAPRSRRGIAAARAASAPASASRAQERGSSRNAAYTMVC